MGAPQTYSTVQTPAARPGAEHLFCAERRALADFLRSPRVEKCLTLGKTMHSSLSLFSAVQSQWRRGGRNIATLASLAQTKIVFQLGSIQLQQTAVLDVSSCTKSHEPRQAGQFVLSPFMLQPSLHPEQEPEHSTVSTFLQSEFVDNTNYLQN